MNVALKSPVLRLGFLILFSLSILASACRSLPYGYVDIQDLNLSPEKFSGRTFRIKGSATAALKIPFLSARIYTIKDSTGEIAVRTEKEPPYPGELVHIEGTLENIAIIGDQNVGLHVHELARW